MGRYLPPLTRLRVLPLPQAELTDMERGYKKQITDLNASWQAKYDALEVTDRFARF